MRQTSGNLGKVNQLNLTMDETLLDDTRHKTHYTPQLSFMHCNYD